MANVDVGSIEDLQARGCITAKAGSQPICVFWHEGKAFAVDDRCPHMGFPLHRGTVENGIVTCHWHHARFDLASGGTFDPFADDVRAYPVALSDGRVVVVADPPADQVAELRRRLEEGLEQGITLVTAKSVLGLLDAGTPPNDIVAIGAEFGTRYRRQGFGFGLVVLTAMANLIPDLDPSDVPAALVWGLVSVSRSTLGSAPRFPHEPLGTDADPERLVSWFRRFIDTRSEDAAERTLVTAIAANLDSTVATMVFTAATDHVLPAGGHVIDFTNKAYELLEHIGEERAISVLPTLVPMAVQAQRSEELGEWRYPHDLTVLIADAEARLPELLAAGRQRSYDEAAVSTLGWSLLDDDPEAVVSSILAAVEDGASLEQLGRAVALAAALRITRFHIQNDHGDWNVVHHAFTAANALHQSLLRAPSAALARGLVHVALRVYLDRFLNVPAARLPTADAGDLSDLQRCWDEQGHVDEAGSIVYGFLRSGGDPAAAVGALAHGLLSEDAEFHWFQIVEAAVRQFSAWPSGSEEGRLILAGAARFLAAHTPTRRELPQVVNIATRLRRGEALFEES